VQDIVRDCNKQRFAMKPNPATNGLLDRDSTDPAHWLIRANQGHTIKIESEGLLRPIVASKVADDKGFANGDDDSSEVPENAVPVPPTVVHGTYLCFWPAIEAAGGLKPMDRNHVHFSTGLPSAWARAEAEDTAAQAADGSSQSGGDKTIDAISGMRQDAELLVYIDVEKAMQEAPAMKWWMSDNGVVLTEGDENGLVPLRFFRRVVGRPGLKVRKKVVVELGVLWKDGEKVGNLPDGVKGIVPRGKGWMRFGRGRGNGRGGGRGRG
jgi:2'-phosphotransferase